MIHEFGNIELCELLDMEPKTQCKVCLPDMASSTARAGTSCKMKQKRIRNPSSTRWTFSFPFLTAFWRRGELTGTVTGRSEETRNTTLPINSRRSVKGSTTRVSTIDSQEMTNSAGIWLNLVEPKIFVAKQMILRTKNHSYHLTPQEVDNYKSKWLIRSNKIGSDTMPIRYRFDFKQVLSTLQQLKEKEEAQRNQRWTQSYSSSWWSWQGTWWTPYSHESHHGDVPSSNLINK